MDKKKFRATHKDFILRLLSIIDMKEIKFWTKELGAQHNLIWSWKNDIFPSLEYAFRICELSGVSANWLFFNEGPQFLKDCKFADSNNFDKKESVNTQLVTIFNELEIQKIEYEEKIKVFELKIIELEKKIKLLKTANILNDLSEGNIKNTDISKLIEDLAYPIFVFLSDNSNNIFQLLNEHIHTKTGRAFLANIISSIITRYDSE
jgi:hypothetical protein